MKINTTYTLVVVVFISSIAGAVFFSKKNIRHPELLEVQQRCATLARDFAGQYVKTSLDFQRSLKILLSNYNVRRRSCFVELDESGYFPHSGKSFSEYNIYDVLSGERIDSLTYKDSDSQLEDYLSKNLPRYRRVRKTIFGSDILDKRLPSPGRLHNAQKQIVPANLQMGSSIPLP